MAFYPAMFILHLLHFFCEQTVCTVNLRSKRPGRKGNSLLRDIDLSLNMIFLSYFYVGCKKISVQGKNLSGSMKSL